MASTVGTTIEWYDFFIYGTAAALVFPSVFFPEASNFLGVLASFGTMFVGFIARPIGGILFGHYGDRVGRKSTLVITLLMMGAATVLIGLLPGYRSIGVAAPILLIVLRMLQGIAVGGEWAGSVLMSMEGAKPSRRGLMASWPQMGVPLGVLLSLAAVKSSAGATGNEFLTWGWRLPFLASALLIAIGLYVRLKVEESPEFQEVKNQEKVARMPVWEALRTHPRLVFATALVRMGQQAPYYLFTTFLLSYGTEHLGMARDDLLNATIAASSLGLITVPLSGYLSDLFGRRKVYLVGLVGMGLFALPYYSMVNTGQAGLVIGATVLGVFLHDLQYGPQAALISEGFGARVRYSGASLGYQLGSVIAGGPAPLIAAYLLQRTGSSTAISFYIIGCVLLSLIALALIPRTREVPSSADGRQIADTAEAVL
ncbi:MFS transporter [Streptomyces albiflavescens]|uniref:MFS transporter n=1 Tax=Streptomyces albiflavescens TaxID=1623582 RepID=UPI001E64C972|nr:MFS transporter [Streptomyces albiflavescens]